MRIQALFRIMADDGQELYNQIRKGSKSQQISRGEKAYWPKLHDVASKSYRPDKRVFVPNGERDPVTGEEIMVEDTESVSRIPLAFENYIIKQKATFTAGGGVTLKPSKEGSQLFKYIEQNWYDNKTDYQLEDIFRQVMAYTECAVIFFGERGAERFEDFRYKFKVVSPEKGDVLEPVFDDDSGDMIAFGREYTLTIDGKDVTRYDLYVINEQGFAEIRRYENGAPLLSFSDELGEPTYIFRTPYTKLPVVYWSQEAPECDITSEAIREFEFAFSDFCSQQSYSAEPILFGRGTVLSLPPKNSPGKYIEGSADSSLEFVTPDNATESRELQFRMLRDFIFGLNRAAYMDLETMKSIGSDISGVALKYLLIDLYADASSKQKGYLGMGVQRMVNWMLHEWKKLTGLDKDLRVYAEFSQYEVEDEMSKIDLAMKANGGLPVMTHASSITYAGLEEDSVLALETINKQGNGDNSN